MSRREDPCGIFNMLFIETAIHFFLFFFHYLFSFRPVEIEIYLYFVKGLHQKAFAKKHLVSKYVQNIKPVQKCAKYEVKPVQYAQVSYFAHFSRLFFVISR